MARSQVLFYINCDLCVEVRLDLVVTMPGTSLRIVYRKPRWGFQLVARLTRAEFLARALKAANDKARELGWISKKGAGRSTPPLIANTELDSQGLTGIFVPSRRSTGHSPVEPRTSP